MRMFKVGDRVKCVKVYAYNTGAVGKEGKVIGFRGGSCGVEFFEKLDMGHCSSLTGGRGRDGYCWNFPVDGGYLELVTEHKNPATLVTIEVFNNTTVAKLREGDKVIRTGVARCNPGDVFDAYEGARLALDRLYGKVEPYKRKKEQKKPGVREVKRPAKVGEWIKIVDADCSFSRYKNGDVFKVVRLYGKGGHVDIFEDITAVYVPFGEYVVLENYEPDKEGR